jgi:hypothetical protein
MLSIEAVCEFLTSQSERWLLVDRRELVFSALLCYSQLHSLDLAPRPHAIIS